MTCQYFVHIGNGSDVDIVTFYLHMELNGTTLSTSWFFESLPKVFYLLYLGRIQIESIISLKIYDLRDAFNQECESLHKI